MALWEESAHRNSWLYSKETLEDARARSANRQHLTAAEEAGLIIHYGKKVEEIVKTLKLPDRCKSTASILFRRLSLVLPVEQLQLKHAVQQAVYIACKAEECYISADQLASTVNDDASNVLKREAVALDALQYDVACFSPFRSVDGLISQFDSFCAVGDGLLDRVPGLKKCCNELLLECMVLTDAVLLLSPGQLAFACLCLAAKQLHAHELVQQRAGSIVSHAEAFPSAQHAESMVDELLHDARSFELSHSELEDVAERIRAARQQQQQSKQQSKAQQQRQ